MDRIRQNIQQSLRSLLRAPGLTAIIVLSLGIGIGANTAVFTIVYELLLKNPPFSDVDKLVILWESNPSKDNQRSLTSMANVGEWSRNNRSFQGIAAFGPAFPVTVKIGNDEAEVAGLQIVTAELLDVLGVQPAIGSGFDPVTPGGSVILSNSFWRRRFNSNPGAIGKTISLPEGAVATIVGVMPSGFDLGNRHIDLWRGMRHATTMTNGDVRWLSAVGRLRPGVSRDTAQQELAGVAAELERRFPERNRGWSIRLESLRDALGAGHNQKPMLHALFGAVAFTLLIACLNVASLLLTRALARRSEFSIRAALGASRRALAAGMMADGFVLMIPSALLGLLCGAWALGLFLKLAPPEFSALAEFSISSPVLAFTVGLSVLSCMSAAFVPAVQTSRLDLMEGIKNSGTRSVSAPQNRTRKAFVVVEVALAFVLVVAGGLMASTFGNLARSHIGFDPKHLSATTFFLTGREFAERVPGQDLVAIKAPVDEFYIRLIERVRGLPGVEAAGVVSRLPGAPMTTLLRGKFVGPIDLAELPFTAVPPKVASVSDWPTAKYNMVSGGFFESMRIPLVRGRYISDADVADSPWVAVISEAAARRYWPGEDPIGHNIAVTHVDKNDQFRRIVGIVADVRQYGPFTQPAPEIYTSFRQQRSTTPGDYAHRRVGMTVVARGPNPYAIAAAVYKAAADIDPQQPVYASYSMEEVLGMAVAPWRFGAVLLGAFSAVGLLLAGLGLYGVMARRVAERARDISIRIALGAEPTVMMRKVISEGMLLTLAGLGLGVIVSIPSNQILASKLFGVSPKDPVYFLITCGVLAATALAALWIPARRAANLDPVDSLREM